MVRRLKKIRRGAAAVEMAIVLTLLVMLTMGAIQYGMLFLRTQQITNAARQGARIAILPDVTDDDVLLVISNLMTAAGMGGAYLPPNINDVVLPGDVQAVSVRIIVPSENIALMNTPLLPVPENLGAEVTMAKESP